jgi:hypothetical protein
VKRLDGYLSRRAQAALDPRALVWAGDTWTLDIPGEDSIVLADVSIGSQSQDGGFQAARDALTALISAGRARRGLTIV